VFQKMGAPFRQMHSWDYSGPYHGYDGFAIFARGMDMAINAPIWKMAKAPWKAAPKPILMAADGAGPRSRSVRSESIREHQEKVAS